MKLLLHMKHWQLFLFLFGVPIIFEIISITTMFAQMSSALSSHGNINDMLPFSFTLFFITMIISFIIFFLWFWTIGTNLYTKLPSTASMKLNRFKAFLIFPAIYMFVILFFVYLLGNGMAVKNNPSPFILLIIPLHLFTMFCMFYLLYFVAKTFKAVELQRPVEFSDYAGEFFLLWFFFIGVWALQPKINKIFADDTVG